MFKNYLLTAFTRRHWMLAMNKWLEDFAYRTTISWWMFAICGASMLLIAFLTLGIQTVKSIRTE